MSRVSGVRITKFYLESKGPFIHISSIASFKPFLIAWLREYCTFSDSSVVGSKSSLWPKYTQYGTILQKEIIFYYQTFFRFKKTFFIRLFLANTKQKIGGHRARLIEKGHLFRYRAQFEGNFLGFARAHVLAPMTRNRAQ